MLFCGDKLHFFFCLCASPFFYTDLTTETLDSEFFQNIAKKNIPLMRYGKEGELDSCALFLASAASTYVTGQYIAVDGGYTCV